MKLRIVAFTLALLALGLPAMVRAADDDLRKELDKVKKELEEMKKEKATARAPIASAQAAVEGKYGPNTAVTTKQGKLTIGGLVQVWYYSIQDDNIGFFGDNSPTTALGGDTNEMKDNDSFAIRRAQLRFTMDIHENVTAVVMIDPARAINGRPSFPSNAGLFTRGAENGFSGDAMAVRYGENAAQGSSIAQRNNVGSDANQRGILEDAYINYHGVVPHHDFTVGQHRKFLGEEGIRSDASLDFVERSMIGQTYTDRDLGLTAHGTWWDDRFQYWLGVFNDAGNWFQSAGPQQNRVDDNDEKSFVWRVLVRPLWKNETWGSLELGASGEHSTHGESGGDQSAAAVGSPVDGLGFQQTGANRYYAWASYRPGGPVRGWWLKGEWGMIQDRNAKLWVQTLNANGFANAPTNTITGGQTAPNPHSKTGFYFATGYKISDSIFKDSAPGWLKNFEFAFKYEQFENVQIADHGSTDARVANRRTDVFATDVWTAGINYYIKGDNAKIQINYIVVDNPDDGATVTRGYTGAVGTATGPRRNFHAVDNNSLVVNFQVAW